MFIAPQSSGAAAQNGIANIAAPLVLQSRLSDTIARRLGVDIVRGFYSIGQALPTELGLAKRWNVSRSAVREGLAILVSKGLLETKTKTGTTVRRRAQWHLLDPDVLSWMQQARPDTTFIRSLVELRLIIEPPAAALAAQNRSRTTIDTLQRLLDIIGDPDRPEEVARRADIQFHRTFVEATGNPALLPLAASVEAAVSWTHGARGRPLHLYLTEYGRILDAVRHGDEGEAKCWMEALIRSTLEPRSPRA